MKIGAAAQELWLGNLLGPGGSNLVSRTRSQTEGIIWDIMILLNSSYDSGKNEVLFVKTGVVISELWMSIPRKLQKPIKNFLLGAVSGM